MSTTVSYKGSTITTVDNQTRTLLTQGKYLEANIILTDQSSGGGTIQSLTVNPSTSQQTFNASGVDGYKPVVVNAMPTMTLPQYPESTSTGTRAGMIFTGLATRYLNIPTGYNSSAKHYEISPMNLGRKVITQNGTYTAEYDDLDGYYEVEVDVSGGGGGGTPWNVSVLALAYASSTAALFRQNGEIYDVVSSPNVGAWVLLSTTTVTNPSVGHIIACIGDSSGVKTYAYTSSGVAEVATNNVYLSVPDNDGVALNYDSQSGGYVFSNTETYALIVFYKQSSTDVYRTLTYRTATYAPGSGQTSAQYTVSENPPIYFCGLSTTVSLASYHRVNTVTKIDYQNFRNLGATNFYTNTIGYLQGGVAIDETYANGTLTISTNSTSDGGYFHNPGTYTLHYLTASDLQGGSGGNQSKTRTYTPSQQTQTETVTYDSGYDGLEQVAVTVNPIPSEYLIPTGNYAITANGNNINVAQYATVSVNVPSSGGANIATATMTNSSNQNTSISFTLPSGRTPKAFFARLTSQIARSSGSRYYYVYDMRWDGSSTGGVAGNTFYMYNGTLTNVTSGYSYSQSGTTFTLSSTGSRSASPGSFYNGTYELTYIY